MSIFLRGNMTNSDNNEEKIYRKLPEIEDISVEMPAVSEYCDVTRLPELFKQQNTDTLPVINLQGKIIGMVSEYDVAQILPEWSFKEKGYQCDVKVHDIMSTEVWRENKHLNINELSDKISKMHVRVIPIVDNDNTYTGKTITRSAIIEYFANRIKPSSLGGLATPLGVYITDGKHQAGANNLGLFLSGITIGSIFIIIEQLLNQSYKYFHINTNSIEIIPLIFAAQIIIFIGFLRLTPLAKFHAAEHQTINAIEKGLPLRLEIVKMQPREHLRCGTNIMVLLIGIQFVILTFFGYLKHFDPLLQFVFLFMGFIFVFSNWKSWGLWLQKHFTTAKAPDSYILGAIKVGEEILRKHKEDTDAKPASFFRKIWCSSILQILAGFIFIQWVFGFLLKIL